MTIISRYVLLELLKVFLVSLAALTLFMVVIGLVKEAQQQGLGAMQIAALLPYVLPEAMRFAVPGTMLFAVCSVFGRLASSNEITALKAAGISPLVVFWPATILAGGQFCFRVAQRCSGFMGKRRSSSRDRGERGRNYLWTSEAAAFL